MLRRHPDHWLFALFQALTSMPNPDLLVGDVGIGMPLSHTDAATIITASNKAPFGKGKETVVDEKIRKTRELASDEFTLANPKWDLEIRNILNKVSHGLL